MLDTINYFYNEFFTEIADFFIDLMKSRDIALSIDKNNRLLHVSIFVLIISITLYFVIQ